MPLAKYLQPFMSDIDDTHAGIAAGEVNAVRKNGKLFVAEINASTVMAGDSQVFVISLRDITGRRETERTLRENEERYRAMVENPRKRSLCLTSIATNSSIPMTTPAGYSTCRAPGC